MNKAVKVAVLDAVERKYWADDEGRTDSQKFIDLLLPLNPVADFEVFYVTENQFPRSLVHYDAVLLTGSPASVHDEFDWIAKTSDLIRQADHLNKAVFASCFGHQLVAKTFGGTVGYNENGWMIGNYKLKISRHFDWMPAKIPETGVFHFNQERVTALPPAAVSFASSDEYPDMACTLGDNILSIQGHPEQPLSSMNNFLNAMQHGLDQQTLTRARSQIDNGKPHAQLWGKWIMRFICRSI